MKKITFMAVLFFLLASTNQANAQLIVRNTGHAELGVNPSTVDLDTVTTLKIFGDIGANKAGGRITFGDSAYVAIGEYGLIDSDKIWVHGKNGIYITKGSGTLDTIAFFDPSLSTNLNVNSDILAHGVLIQSDERYKENIEPVEDVLNSLLILEPVTYQLKSHHAKSRMSTPAQQGKSAQDAEAMNRYYQYLEQGSERYGFLAQNVKEAFPQLVHTDANGMMSVDYIGLIPILVQSINELRAELAAVKGEKQQEENTAPMLQVTQQTSNDEIAASLNDAKLYQNAPNPWNSETVIRYSLPQSVSRADIYIYDMQGAQLKCIPAQGRGENQVTLTASDLKAGMYLYALVADGALIDSKQMILTK